MVVGVGARRKYTARLYTQIPTPFPQTEPRSHLSTKLDEFNHIMQTTTRRSSPSPFINIITSQRRRRDLIMKGVWCAPRVCIAPIYNICMYMNPFPLQRNRRVMYTIKFWRCGWMWRFGVAVDAGVYPQMCAYCNTIYVI